MATTTHLSPFETDHRVWLVRSFRAAMASLSIALVCFVASIIATSIGLAKAGTPGSPGTFGSSVAPAVEGSGWGQLGHLAIVVAWCCAASWSYRAAESLRHRDESIRPLWHAVAWLIPVLNVAAVPWFLSRLIRTARVSVPAWVPAVWSAIVFVPLSICATFAGFRIAAHDASWEQGRNAVSVDVIESVYRWMLAFHVTGAIAATASGALLFFLHTALSSLKDSSPVTSDDIDVAEFRAG